MKEFIENAIAYAKANPVLVGVIAACVLVALIVLIALIAKASKNKKAKKLAAVKTTETVKAEESKPAPVKEEPKAEIKAEPVKEEPKTEIKAEPVKEEPKTEIKAEPVKEEPKTEIKAEPVKEESQKEAKATEKPAEKPITEKKTLSKAAASKLTAKKTETVKAEDGTEKKADEKTEVKPAAKKPSNRYKGKWVIYDLMIEDKNGAAKEEAFFFELHASNGELLLSSEEYTSHSGAVSGIETHKANIEKGNFKITLSKKGDYIFKLLNGKNTLLCTGANYPTLQGAESAVESTKRFAKTAVLQERVEELHIAIPDEEEEEEETPVYDDSIVGKWIVSSKSDADGNSVYYFELFASNGEKLLSSEEYTTYVGAVNGISTHKTNIEKGNFRISLTKRGDYIFKLLSGNGQLLCLGEHYKTKTRCENAVESVKRFAKSSPVLAASELTD